MKKIICFIVAICAMTAMVACNSGDMQKRLESVETQLKSQTEKSTTLESELADQKAKTRNSKICLTNRPRKTKN